MTENERVCQYCGRELPFAGAREYHEALHEENAWEKAYDGVTEGESGLQFTTASLQKHGGIDDD